VERKPHLLHADAALVVDEARLGARLLQHARVGGLDRDVEHVEQRARIERLDRDAAAERKVREQRAALERAASGDAEDLEDEIVEIERLLVEIRRERREREARFAFPAGPALALARERDGEVLESIRVLVERERRDGLGADRDLQRLARDREARLERERGVWPEIRRDEVEAAERPVAAGRRIAPVHLGIRHA